MVAPDFYCVANIVSNLYPEKQHIVILQAKAEQLEGYADAIEQSEHRGTHLGQNTKIPVIYHDNQQLHSELSSVT